jgi:hypothetical protein
MWTIAAAGIVAIAAAGGIGAAEKAQVSVKTMPPSVVKTVPQAGETNVNPNLTEVRATFSKDMITKEMWSWCYQTPETFPEIDKTKIRFLDDKRTCVLPVKLKPEKTYVIWINSQKFNHFKDTGGNSAVPYLLVFQTGKEAPEAGDAGAAAVAVAESWLKLVDAGKYDKSWDEAAQLFKKAITKINWRQALGAARKPLGKNISRKVKTQSYRTSLPGAPDGKYVVIQFESSFENKKSAIETVTPMMDKDGKWRVSGYYIK